jgi:hypothetical protein
MTDKQIQNAIRNASGLGPGLFVPEGAFVSLSQQQIQRLE